MSAGSSGSPNKRGSKPKGAVRAKSGCYTCRIRRKKCDEKMDDEGSCQTCARLRLQCLGFGAKRPDWMREGNSVQEIREKIKTFLAQNGMIKGHSGTANLRSVGPATSPQGVSFSAGANATSPSGSLHPLQNEAMPASGANSLNTPLSATSTLTPEDRSSSPSTPPNSRAHHNSLLGDRPFPPNNGQLQDHFDHSVDAPGMQRGELTSGILYLSNGRPTPMRTQSARVSRHQGYGHNFGDAVSGLGLMSMDPLDTNGSGISNNNNHTRYEHHICGTLPFPRAHSTTAIGQPSMNTMTRFHAPPTSSVSSFTGRPASAFPGASRSNAYPHTPSNGLSAANLISNTMHVASPTFGSASSTSSSPPMAPFTPYTPQISLPALPSNDIKTNVDMVWSSAMSAPSSTPFSIPTPVSDAPLLSPCLDAGPFGPVIDGMDTYRISRQHPIGSGSGHGFESNNDTGSTTPTGVRVKIEPDVDGFTLRHGYAAHDSNIYARHSYGTADALRPRSSTFSGCATPSPNTLANYNSDVTNNELGTTTMSCPTGVYGHNDNLSNNYARNSFPSDTHAFHGSHASTSMGMRGHATFAPHAMTVDSPYAPIPQLAPDSPKPPRHDDPMIGAYTSNPTQSVGPAYVNPGHHGTDEFTLTSGTLRPGAAGQSGIGSGPSGHGYGHTNGYGHNQTAPGSSWPVDTGERSTLHNGVQQQQQEHSQASFGWSLNSGFPNTPAVPRNDLPPPSIQSSFGASYNVTNYAMELVMNGMDALSAQPAPMGGMTTVNGVDGSIIPYYSTGPALIEEQDFYNLSQEEQQRVYQELAPLQAVQPAPMDPLYADRVDRSLVEHYLQHVRPKQYFFWDDRVVGLLHAFALSKDAVRDAICSVASVHIRRMREGSIQLRGRTPQSPSRRAQLLLGANASDVPEGDNGNAYYDRTQLALSRAGQERLTEAEAMAGLQCISSFLFAGGVGGWDYFLGIACQWVEMTFASLRRIAGDAFLLGELTKMKRENELGSIIVRTTMWFEVLASVTMVRPPRFLGVYQVLFADNGRIVEVDNPVSRAESEFSMLEVMGCDNLTFLAIAEISALAAWKEEETKKQTLSFVELAERKAKIEERCLQALAEAEANIIRDGSALYDDSLQNRRRLTADIFRASARLYLHTVLSGDKPGVKEIREGVRDTIDALKRVPAEPKSLRCSVVRSVVFPLCLAGCMTDDDTERGIVKEFLEGEGGAGNCGSVVAVMETVWERRDAKRKGGRRSAGAGESANANVSWRDVLRERGGGMPILLV